MTSLLLAAVLLAAPAPQKESLYQLPLKVLDQTGKQVGLDVFKGQPVLVSMFYATCPGACPLLVSAVKRIDAAVDPATRKQLRILLVSFDAKSDTAQVMEATAKKFNLDARWLLTSAQEDDARELAALLDLKYRKLPEGGFNHSSVLVLLDKKGAIAGRWETLPFPAQPIADKAKEVRAAR